VRPSLLLLKWAACFLGNAVCADEALRGLSFVDGNAPPAGVWHAHGLHLLVMRQSAAAAVSWQMQVQNKSEVAEV
jgi:hypothetical protein